MVGISVIIPVYNGEKCIEKCIDNIINQLNSNSELIVINDGSIDSTKRILQKYENNKKIICIEIENGGVSNARNIGIKVSSKEFIMFCDSDDYYDNDVVSYIENDIENENPDLIIFGRKDILQSGNVICNFADHASIKSYVLTPSEYLVKYFSRGKHTFSVANKVYKKKIILDATIKFDSSLKLSEDTLFNLQYILHCKNYVEEYRTFYNRICNEGSVIYSPISDFYEKNTKVIRIFQNYLSNMNIKLETYQDAINLLYYHYGSVTLYRTLQGMDSKSDKVNKDIIIDIFNDINYRQGLIIRYRENGNFKDKVKLSLQYYNYPKLYYILLGKIVGFVRRNKK